MAVTRVFPRRQEDPLIQQLLERARREAAQSSAIGSPSMYTAAAGGGAGPAFGVLTAQVLAGVRSGTAQREAQQRQEMSNQAASMLRRAETTGQLGDGVIVNEMGNLLRMGTPTQIDRVNVTDTSSYQNVTPQDLTATQIPLEPTTIRLGPEDDPNFLERAFLGRTLKGQDISNIDQLKVAAGYDPLEYDLSMKELSRKNIKTTFTKPEQKNVTTTIDGKESTEPATLRYKTTTDSFGNTEQIIEKRENGVFVELGPNQKISSDLKENKLNEKNYVYQGIKPITYIDKNNKQVVIKRGQRVIFDKNNPSDVSLLKLINDNPNLFRIGSMYSTSNLQETKPLALRTNLTEKIGYIGTKKDLTIDNRIEQIITLDQDLKNDDGEVIVNKGTYNSIDNADDFNLIKSLAEATSVSERNLDKRIVLKDSGAMKKLGEDLQQKRNSLKGIYRLITKIDNSDVGFNRFFDDFKSKYNTLLANGLTPKEIALRAARGETQGLIGALRLDVLGPGVVTEQDALRLLAFIGGQAGAFENVAVFREQIKGILDVAEQNFLEDFDLYNKLKTENPERYRYTIDIQDVTKDFQKRPFFDDTTIPDLSSGAIRNAKPGSVIWNRLSKLIEDNPNTYQNMMTPLQLEALEEMLQ